MTFNEHLHARVLAKDMDGALKVLDHMKFANIAENAMSLFHPVETSDGALAPT